MMKRLVYVLTIVMFLAGCQKPDSTILPRVVNALAELPELVDSCGVPVLQYCYFSPQGELHGLIQAQDTVFEIPQTIDEQSIFQAASLSKPVFAYIVMRMVDRGEIDLDRPIAEYTDIERFDDKEMAQKLTPRIVLSHQTGLPNWAASPSLLRLLRRRLCLPATGRGGHPGRTARRNCPSRGVRAL